MPRSRLALLLLGALLLSLSPPPAGAQEAQKDALDAQVEAFLKEHQHRWRDLNIPTAGSCTI
jgi:hypothetical protein